MWFLFVEIFVLMAVSFAVGSLVALLGVRLLVRSADSVAPTSVVENASEVTK